MMEEVAKTIAETTFRESQLIRNHSPSADPVPSTSADRVSITINRNNLPSIQFASSRANLQELSRQQEDEDESESEISVEDSPRSSPARYRRPPLPAIPDLRFEQSYLRQLEAAKGSIMWMIIITIREQVILPGVQGFLWALAMTGIRSLRVRQAENGQEWGSWLRDSFGRLVRTDATMMRKSE